MAKRKPWKPYYWGVLGFKSYKAYLASDLWASIRKRQLSRAPRCHCGEKATQVHHQNYTWRNINGFDLEGLFSICYACHKRAHGRAPNPQRERRIAANKKRRKKKRRGKGIMCPTCGVNRTHKHGPCPPCRARKTDN